MSDRIFTIILSAYPQELKYILQSDDMLICEKFDKQGLSLLHICIINSKVELMKVLLEYAQKFSKQAITA